MDPNSGKQDSALRLLATEVERDFNEIHRRRDDCMECGPGCSDCCRARLAVTRVEEAWLRRGLASLPEAVRIEQRRRVRDPGREMCPALDDSGRCEIYAFRPLICRSYGVPLRRRQEVPLVNPPRYDVCDKNFRGRKLGELPANDVLDQTELETRIAEIDDEYCASRELPRGERIGLAQILGSEHEVQSGERPQISSTSHSISTRLKPS